MNYARLLHMTNMHTQTCYLPTWHKIQTRTAGRSFDTCFSVTLGHSGTHLSCKLTSAAIHMRLSVTAFPFTFWPQMNVKEGGREGGRGVQVGYLTALDSSAWWRACFVPSFSHRYYSSYIKAVQVCGWNICFYLLRQLEDRYLTLSIIWEHFSIHWLPHTKCKPILQDRSPFKDEKCHGDWKVLKQTVFLAPGSSSLAQRPATPASFPCCLRAFVQAAEERGISYTSVKIETVLTAGTSNESPTVENLLCGDQQEAPSPAGIHFNMLLEAVIHSTATQNATHAVTNWLDTGNK